MKAARRQKISCLAVLALLAWSCKDSADERAANHRQAADSKAGAAVAQITEVVPVRADGESSAPAPLSAFQRLGDQVRAEVRDVALPGSLTFRIAQIPPDAVLDFGYSTTPVADPRAAVDLEVSIASARDLEGAVEKFPISNVAHRPGPAIERIRTHPASARPERLADGVFGEAWTAPTSKPTMIQFDFAQPVALTAFALGMGQPRSRRGIPSRLRVAVSRDGKRFAPILRLDRRENPLHLWHLLPGEPIRGLRIWIEKTHDGGPALIDEVLLSTAADVGDIKNGLGRWNGGTIDLTGYAGDDIEVTFRFGALRPSALAEKARGMLSGPRLLSARREGEKNVILISLDTVRGDRISAFGYERPTTPFIARLVDEADTASFTNARSTSTWTPPSHLAMMTGRTPFQLRVNASRARITSRHLRGLDPSIPTLASILGANGYATYAISSPGGTDGSLGLRNGFAVYEQPWSMLAARPIDYHGELVSRAEHTARWLEQHQSRKFFLFLHTYVAHAPYKSVEFAGCEASEAASARCKLYLAKLNLADNRLRRGTEWGKRGAEYESAGVHTAHTMSDLYDGGLRLADDFVKHVIDALDRLRLRDDTIVVITSDHGEPFGEHHRNQFDGGHGRGFYDEYLGIPLIFRVPGLGRAIRSDAPVSLVDIPPTLLELLQIQSAAPFEGRSLVPAMRGLPHNLDLRPIFYEVLSEEHIADPHLIAASRANFKILANLYDLFDGKHALYNLSADPGESHDVAAVEPAIAGDLLQELDRHIVDAFRGMFVIDVTALGRKGRFGIKGTATFSEDVRLFEIAVRKGHEFVRPVARGDRREYEINLAVDGERRLIGFLPPTNTVRVVLELKSSKPCEIRVPTGRLSSAVFPVEFAVGDLTAPALSLQTELARGKCSIGLAYVEPDTNAANQAVRIGASEQIDEADRERVMEHMRALGYVD